MGFWQCISFQIRLFWVSMLLFGGVAASTCSLQESVEPSGQLTLSRLPMRSVLCARMHLRGTLDFAILSLLPEAILQSVCALRNRTIWSLNLHRTGCRWHPSTVRYEITFAMLQTAISICFANTRGLSQHKTVILSTISASLGRGTAACCLVMSCEIHFPFQFDKNVSNASSHAQLPWGACSHHVLWGCDSCQCSSNCRHAWRLWWYSITTSPSRRAAEDLWRFAAWQARHGDA